MGLYETVKDRTVRDCMGQSGNVGNSQGVYGTVRECMGPLGTVCDNKGLYETV